jgi:hypothetical protein
VRHQHWRLRFGVRRPSAAFLINLLKANYLSLFDKKDLTNGIDGFILCAMNANEISPKGNARLNRIKIVSRIVRCAILGLFVLSIVFFLLFSFASWRLAMLEEHPIWFGLVNLPQVVLWVWYWKLAKLFHLYERGLIFATATIRCIKTLGILCVVNWLLLSAYNVWERIFPQPQPLPPVLPPHVTVTVAESSFRMGFFTFSIAGISFGLLLAGIIITVIAWIMDEGRKIQEEQELTV